MKRVLLIASAFIGLIIGAGFASGQEILQYFSSFGMMGLFAAIVATAMFMYIGMMLLWLGSKMKATNHKEVIRKITGYNMFGNIITWIIDIVLILTLFGLGVVMIAGGGSNLEQQFGLPTFVGSLLMLIMTIIVGMMNVDGVVKVIGYITPFIIGFIVLIAIFSIVTTDQSMEYVNRIAETYESPLPHWFISGVNYVSLNIGLGASMCLVMGGNEERPRQAAIGGLVGGLGLGSLIVLSHLAIFTKIHIVGDLPLPMLGIVNDISSILGVVMSLIIYMMIFNTAVGMFYSLSSRFTVVGTKQFKLLYSALAILGFILSFIGFTELVNIFYPIIGYLGLILIAVLIYAPIKIKLTKGDFFAETENR